jgi:hypothetical protein
VKLLRRIAITLVIALAGVFVTVNWIAPVALSFYAAQKAPAVASIVPVDLKDKSISKAPGQKLSYFGYEFEVPWSDLDETHTKLYPQDKSEKTKVDLRFRSGLRLVVSGIPPREWAKDLPTDFNVSGKVVESALGRETMQSDYSFIKALYEFTPNNMNHWTASQGAHSRDELLLMVKSLALSNAAETGIFNLQNQGYKGFQEGNPRVRQDKIIVDLYSDKGSVEMIFFQGDYHNFAGVTQSEINRIVQSLRKGAEGEPTAPRVAQK